MTKSIICIHGAGGGGWEYAKWQPIFAEAGYAMIANDLLPSSAGLAATTFDDYARQVQAWLPPIGPLILVGASMGGILALTAAKLVKPAALVLINSVLPAGSGLSRRAEKQYPAVVHWANGPIEETRAALFDSDEPTIQWAWQRWRDESGAVLSAIARGIEVTPPTCPTLVVLGKEDTDIPYRSGLALAEWAKADVHLYDGMSHVGPLVSRRAEQVARAVLGWCETRFDNGMTRGTR